MIFCALSLTLTPSCPHIHCSVHRHHSVQESADAELTVANTTITRLEAEGTTLRNDLREAQAQIARLEESMARGEKSYDTVASVS